MTLPSTPTDSSAGIDHRRRIQGTFLAALVGTPWLLLLGPTRRIVSPESTLLAVLSGWGLGAVVAIGAADFDPAASDAMQAVVALACIFLLAVVVWLVVPSRLRGAFVQFTLAFTWTVPVAGLVYHRSRRPGSA